MITSTRYRRPTVYQLRLFAGLVLGVYVTFHLITHSLGLISLGVQEAARPWFMAFWHALSPVTSLYEAANHVEP